MIHEEICTYEVAKLAKEKEFPQHIGNEAYIVKNEYDDKYEVGCCYPIQFIPDYLPTITAPTQSLLQRWLREEKAIAIVLQPYSYDIQRRIYTWIYEIWADNNFEKTSKSFKTYELALDDALKYIFENLI